MNSNQPGNSNNPIPGGNNQGGNFGGGNFGGGNPGQGGGNPGQGGGNPGQGQSNIHSLLNNHNLEPDVQIKLTRITSILTQETDTFLIGKNNNIHPNSVSLKWLGYDFYRKSGTVYHELMWLKKTYPEMSSVSANVKASIVINFCQGILRQ